MTTIWLKILSTILSTLLSIIFSTILSTILSKILSTILSIIFLQFWLQLCCIHRSREYFSVETHENFDPKNLRIFKNRKFNRNFADN